MGVGPHLPLGDIWKCFLFSGFLLHCRPFNFQYGWMWLQLTFYLSMCPHLPTHGSPSCCECSALLAGGGCDLQ